MKSSLASCSPAWGFWGDYMVDFGGGLSAALRLDGCDTTLQSSESLEVLSRSLASMLAQIPPHMMLRFYSLELFAHTGRLERWLRSFVPGTLPSKMAHERAAHCLRVGAPRRRELYAVLTALPEFAEPPRWLGGLMPHRAHMRRDLLESRQRLDTALQICTTHLRSMQVGAHPMGRMAFFDLVWRMANPHRAERMPAPNLRADTSLRNQLFASGLYNGLDFVHRDGQVQRVVTMRHLPQATCATQAMHLQMLDFPHIVAVTLRHVDRNDAIQRLHKSVQRSFDWQKYMLPVLRRDSDSLPDIDTGDKFTNSQAALRQLKDGDSMWEASAQVWLTAADEATLNVQTQQLMSAMRQCGDAEGAVEDYRSHLAYLGMLPGHHRLIGDRFQPLLGSAAADMLPIYKEHEGDKDPTYFVTTKAGQLVGWHPFAKDRVSNNATILGATGAGKSYLIRNLTSGFVAQGGGLVVVTRGSDYHRYADLYGGDIVDVRLDDPNLALGPFFAPGCKQSAEKMMHLASILGVLSQDGHGELSRVTKRLLYSSVQSLYAKAGGRTPNLTDWLAELLRCRDQEPDVRHEVDAMVQQVRYWSEGPYAQVFLRNRPDIACNFSAWNLDLVDDDARGAILALISAVIDRMIRRVPTIIVFDEVWSLLSSAAGAWLIGNLFRTVRRAGSAVWVASQSINDLLTLHPQLRSAILNNSAIQVLLEQKPAEIPDIVKAYGLNAQAAKLLGQCKSLLGDCSSMLMLKPHAQHVVSLKATPLEYWMATSHKPDVALEDALRTKHPEWSRLQVLETLAKRYPHGAI